VFERSSDVVEHVHVADVPGRRQPGCATVGWGRVRQRLEDSGYEEWPGLETSPSGDISSSLVAGNRVGA